MITRYRINYHLHRKIVIIDGRISWTGGFNIGDQYLGRKKKFGYWRDSHVRIVGSASLLLQERFVMDWNASIQNDEFLEWAKYSDNYYGTKKKFVLKALSQGADVLLEIETQGAKKIMEKFPDCITIFFTPPNLDELEKRLRGRKTEDEESIQKRLQRVREELKLAPHYKYAIVNDKVEDALEKLQKVYENEKNLQILKDGEKNAK